MERNRVGGQIQKGEIRNPKGHNQWTYRSEAEKQLSELLKQPTETGRSLSEAVIAGLLEDARNRKPYAMKLLLERILPAVQRHEVESVEAVGLDDLLAALDRGAPEKRGNGSGRPHGSGTGNGAGGAE